MAKQPKVNFPDWLTLGDTDQLAGSILVGQYLFDQMGIRSGKLKYEEWGQFYDAMYQFRKKVPNLTAMEFHLIAHNKYKPPKEAVIEYERLSNILDNLFSMYSEVEDGKG